MHASLWTIRHRSIIAVVPLERGVTRESLRRRLRTLVPSDAIVAFGMGGNARGATETRQSYSEAVDAIRTGAVVGEAGDGQLLHWKEGKLSRSDLLDLFSPGIDRSRGTRPRLSRSDRFSAGRSSKSDSALAAPPASVIQRTQRCTDAIAPAPHYASNDWKSEISSAPRWRRSGRR